MPNQNNLSIACPIKSKNKNNGPTSLFCNLHRAMCYDNFRWQFPASPCNGSQLAQIYRRPGLEPLPWRLQQMETYVFRTCHFGFGGEALKSKKQLWRKKVRTTTSLVVSLHLSSPKNEKAAFFGLQRLEPSTHKLMASHAARRCATKPRKRLRIRLRTLCVCET